jgi:hypothetical protein
MKKQPDYGIPAERKRATPRTNRFVILRPALFAVLRFAQVDKPRRNYAATKSQKPKAKSQKLKAKS